MFQPVQFLDEQKVCFCQLSKRMGDLLSAFLAKTYSVSWRAELLWSCFISLLCWAGFSQLLICGWYHTPNKPTVSSAISQPLPSGDGLLERAPAVARVFPWAARTTANCLIPHIWIHCTPWESKLGQPDRKNCSCSAVRATQKPVVMFFLSVGQHSWGISHQPSLTIPFFLSGRSPLSISWHWHILLAEEMRFK